MNIVVSGHFDPIHAGHIEYLRLAKELGDKLIVIVNNTHQSMLKKGYEFMPFKDRMEILKAIRWVDEVVPSLDYKLDVCETIQQISEKQKIHVFANGGDRNNTNIPESQICEKLGIKVVDGLGKKLQSSSKLVSVYKSLN